jgi:hypothetical protein
MIEQQEVYGPWFARPAEEIEREKALLKSQYFLVRQGELGELYRCRRCGRKHTHLTLMCVERPFSGITGGIFGYCHAGLSTGAYEHLRPEARARFERLKDYFGPNLADEHPDMVRALGVGEKDGLGLGFLLGVLEPLTKTQAQQRVWRINSRGLRPPLVLPGIRGGL